MSVPDPRELASLLLVPDLADLERRAERLIRAAGLTSFAYMFASAGDWREVGWTAHMNGYSPRWIERYREAGHIHADPVPKQCFRAGSHAPFLWRYETPEERAYAADALVHGIGAGVSFPLMTPAGRTGAFSFAVNADGPDAQEFVLARQGWLALLTLHLHDAYQRLSGMTGGADGSSPPSLSPRELECLRWVAAGKTNREMAHEMDMSVRTVKFHLENMRHKFGGVTTRQVVARAIVLRMIQL